MLSLSRICSCVNLTQNNTPVQGGFWCKISKSAFVLGIALSIIFIVLGALLLAGGASFGLLVFGGVTFGLLSCGWVGSLIVQCRRQKLSTNLVSNALRFVKGGIPSLNAQGEAALAYATQLLEDNRGNLEPLPWNYLRPPINEELSCLFDLMYNKRSEVMNILKDEEGRIVFSNRENEQFFVLMTEYLQLAFAVSIYTLRDLDAYMKKYADTASYAQALSRQNSYNYKTFYAMSIAYSLARWLDRRCDSGAPEDMVERSISRFYQEGTQEFAWRALFNNFCERARWYLGDEQEAENLDERMIKHSRADNGREFKFAGTVPT
ncbi:hypothetical protein [Chlamydia felis Fe/C-56]|uniref:Uncharacterized protein n=1 Tax=Chlamydia felis (strain Fe/C-56) TaxID=264202 RepID=Q254R6_CHLFF|nr:hypothetical protein [Chlamydia felis]BAE81222.1 hypothetical protein [Chlamydia felis Fe/C-56]